MITTAAILAGGLGTRLRSILSDRPKALAPVSGRPFLAYLLDQLAVAGTRKVVLCTGYLGEQVRATFGNHYRGLKLLYSHEDEPLGTAGALKLASPLLESDPVLVLNGDSFCDVDLSAFLIWHQNKQAMGSLALFYTLDVSRFGSVVFAPDGQIHHFGEKGRKGDGWINAGVYLLSQCLLSTITKGRVVSLEYEVFPVWAGKGLYGYSEGRSFLDIGTPASYEESEAFFSSGGLPTTNCGRSPGNSQRSTGNRRYVILDRDGTLNIERHYLSDPDDLELLPGVIEGLRHLQAMGLGLVVITNQSAIGRGYFDQTCLEEIHHRLCKLLAERNIRLDGIYCCPHKPKENCICRKPEPGLVYQAAIELSFDPEQSFVIGDKTCDIELGKRLGATTLLVRTGYGVDIAHQGGAGADYIVADLVEAAAVIKKLLTIK